jgi:hypothetical protein
MGECSHDSCTSGSSHHHGFGAGKSSCSCGGKCGCGCCCCTGQCCSCSCHQGKYSDQLLHLADDAWMEVLKEKIKEEIRQNAGEQIAQLAKLVSTSNHARWRDKMQSKRDHEAFETNLRNVLTNPPKK